MLHLHQGPSCDVEGQRVNGVDNHGYLNEIQVTFLESVNIFLPYYECTKLQIILPILTCVTCRSVFVISTAA